MFAKNVRMARIAAELSQERLAFECGLDRTFIGSLEQGIRNISIDNIALIAEALKIPAHELLDPKLAEQRGFDTTLVRAPRSPVRPSPTSRRRKAK
ncbi:helix-turn-helix transcriptional regulator [Variovorax sp. CCNWLW186]|uniref:helix-turn-helix domain-containing protein n=1 Tax=Variovorax sp. CCNWLW186 TaxID=3127473 RepID=UPI003077C7F7